MYVILLLRHNCGTPLLYQNPLVTYLLQYGTRGFLYERGVPQLCLSKRITSITWSCYSQRYLWNRVIIRSSYEMDCPSLWLDLFSLFYIDNVDTSFRIFIGDHSDTNHPFHWYHVQFNLLCNTGHDPSLPCVWIIRFDEEVFLRVIGFLISE